MINGISHLQQTRFGGVKDDRPQDQDFEGWAGVGASSNFSHEEASTDEVQYFGAEENHIDIAPGDGVNPLMQALNQMDSLTSVVAPADDMATGEHFFVDDIA